MDGSHRDVVVEELPELHDHEDVAVAEARHVRVDEGGHAARRGQGQARHGCRSRHADV